MNTETTENLKTDSTEIIIWEMKYGIAPIPGEDKSGTIEYPYLWINEDFVKSLPLEIKTNIAFYSTFVPTEYFVGYNSEQKSDIILANALGNFSTLNEAQAVLLKNTIIDYRMPADDFPKILKLKIINNQMSVEGILYRTNAKVEVLH